MKSITHMSLEAMHGAPPAGSRLWKDWKIVNTGIKDMPPGIHTIKVMLRGSGKVEIDWIRFQ